MCSIDFSNGDRGASAPLESLLVPLGERSRGELPRADTNRSRLAVSACAVSAAPAAATRGGSSLAGSRGRVVLHAEKQQKKKNKRKVDSGDVYAETVLLPKTEFQQRANSKVREPEIQAWWKEKRIYERLLEREAPLGNFCIHDGPPYANGSLHIGHALNKILKDAINKFKTAQGHRVRYIPGWDCHGLPIELKVLQSLKRKEKMGLTPLKLRERAAGFARETVQAQRASFERYGVWGEFDTPYLTLLPKYEAAQLDIFEKMLQGGHIYRGRKPVYWSPSTRTALAEAELEYPEGHTSQSVYAAFRALPEDVPEALLKKLDGDATGLEVAIWTTTPWTIPANRAVAVNPSLEYATVRAEWAESGVKRRMIVAEGLVESLQKTLDATSMHIEATFDGELLEGLQYAHPVTGDAMPVVMGGHYITTESGTGLVHTAPGHGADDYITGQKYDLEVIAPVDDAGNFTAEVGLESLVGANVLKDANGMIVALLEERGLLLAEEPYEHKYPYDWRSKKPVISRATPQWFASIDGLREDTLKALDNVEFIPAKSANVMRPMLQKRNDWCISRQRSWGVPIPAFFKKDSDEVLLTPAIVRHVRNIVAEQGSDAWFALSVEELLPDEFKADSDMYEKGSDTMDVWFDSGSSWAAVRDELGSPVDLYLEGSDQHRGWFQSSLITSVAVQGSAPYKAVLTHGFTVDGSGRKMSKSVGNVMDPKDIIEGGPNQKVQPGYGADTLRLWACSVDFQTDVTISPNIMKTMGQNIATLRNRARFMLGNLHDFDPAKDMVPFEEMTLLDQHVVGQAESTFAEMTSGYGAYAFSRTVKVLSTFMQELSSFYLDLAKERLYILGAEDTERRSCQTVMYWLVESLAKVISPMVSHMAEDIWQNLPGDPASRPESVFLAGWWLPLPTRENVAAGEVSEAVQAYRCMLKLREPGNSAIEAVRKAGTIGGGVEAQAFVILEEAESSAELRRSMEILSAQPGGSETVNDALRCALRVSAAHVVSAVPAETKLLSSSTSEEYGATVSVALADGTKCVRCWNRCPTVGASHQHPGLCARCLAVVEALGFPDQSGAAAGGTKELLSV